LVDGLGEGEGPIAIGDKNNQDLEPLTIPFHAYLLTYANAAKADLPGLFQDPGWFVQSNTNGEENKEKGEDDKGYFVGREAGGQFVS